MICPLETNNLLYIKDLQVENRVLKGERRDERGERGQRARERESARNAKLNRMLRATLYKRIPQTPSIDAIQRVRRKTDKLLFSIIIDFGVLLDLKTMSERALKKICQRMKWLNEGHLNGGEGWG